MLELQTYTSPSRTPEEANHRTWIRSQTTKIFEAFPKRSYPKRNFLKRSSPKRNLPNGKRRRDNTHTRTQHTGNAKMRVLEAQDTFAHFEPDYGNEALLEFTTLLDAEEQNTVAIPWAPPLNQASTTVFPDNSEVGRGERNASISDKYYTTPICPEVVRPSPPLEAPTKAMPSYTEKRTSDQTLEVDDLTRLIDPALLPLELPAVTPEALLPSSLFESQLFLRREAIAKLIAEDRQLDAFEQALSFAFRILSSCPGFTVRTGRYTYSPGVTFPVIALLFEDWWPDVRMQSSLASDLLSLMLRCYGKSPFPDRVDVRELGVGWSSLVVQYGSDSVGPTGNAGGEIGRVRKKIIEEMRLREI